MAYQLYGSLRNHRRCLEAAHWYTRHQADEELTAVEWQHWGEWAADVDNSREYDAFVLLHRRLAALPRPPLPSKGELRGRATHKRRSAGSILGYGFTGPVGVTALAAVLIFVALVGAAFVLKHRPVKPADATYAAVVQGRSVSFSDAALARLRASGRPVFVNLRAQWCPTCSINERMVLDRPAVQQMMARKRVAYLTGDLTHRDAALEAVLDRYSRKGVPLYLLFRPGAADPEAFPPVLTESGVLSELSRLPDKPTGASRP